MTIVGLTNYFEKDGRWSVRARVRTAKGFEHLTTPFLWPTKAAAEDDAKLFIWYRSVRGKNDPPVPTPYGQWFKLYSIAVDRTSSSLELYFRILKEQAAI